MAKVERNEFHDGRVVLFKGDSRDALKELPDNSLDSIATDPPYALVSIVKRFGADNAAPAKDWSNKPNGSPYTRASAGFMGQRWDVGDVAFDPAFWAEGLRVLKPGGHVAAFGGTRTYHRLAVAIEDAGFEIRDAAEFLHESDSELIGFLDSLTNEQRLQFVKLFAERGDGVALWTYGSGFPKSHDVSKGIEKRRVEDLEPVRVICRAIRAAMDSRGLKSRDLTAHFGNCHARLIDHWAARDTDSQPSLPTPEQWARLREFLPLDPDLDVEVARLNDRKGEFGAAFGERIITGTHDEWTDRTNYAIGGRDNLRRDIPATDAARQWAGWGTALKPACEIICLARKPLSEGTVAANVLRWGTGALNIDACRVEASDGYTDNAVTQGINTAQTSYAPAAVRRTFEPSKSGRFPANLIHDGSPEVLAGFPETTSGNGNKNARNRGHDVFSGGGLGAGNGDGIGGDSGSAARFFYTVKADAHGRVGSKHPTVKPVDLMQWLIRLITPPGGVTLDPFAGSGTTGEAALLAGFRAILVEREPQYQADIAQRMAHVFSGKVGRSHVVNKDKAARAEPLPLFGLSPAPNAESE